MSLAISAVSNHLPTCDAEYLMHSECSDTVSYASGTFSAIEQPITPGAAWPDHDLKLRFRVDRAFGANLMLSSKTERLERFDKRLAAIMTVCSAKTDTANQASVGDLVRIEGARLLFDKSVESTGVNFVNVEWKSIKPFLRTENYDRLLMPRLRREVGRRDKKMVKKTPA